MISDLKFTNSDWIALYAAVLSTIIAVTAISRQIVKWVQAHLERSKFKTDLHFLRKIDRTTRETHPIVVILAANLGNERVALKSLEYAGTSENGLKTHGVCGWYEQPEELYGIRNRLLPRVLESGQTADLPMLEIGVITRTQDLKVWLTDFNNRRYYIAESDIEKMRVEVQSFLSQQATAAG